MAKMPRVRSVSAWASFLKAEDLSVPEAVKRTTSLEMKEWLRDNSSKIAEQVAEKETAVATFTTPAEFVEEVEDDEAPAKGTRI